MQVRAGGGLVVRRRAAEIEIAVVHRPKWDDWSLPKGKLEQGEGFAAAALREVEEEAGFRCEIVAELDPGRYRDHRGRLKLVRWYEMRPLGGRFEPGEEVDELRWLAPEKAIALLDYEHERRLVAALAGEI